MGWLDEAKTIVKRLRTITPVVVPPATQFRDPERLEGSVRRAGQRLRITGQLIDALSGTHLWADRFDGSLEDIFELQDKVAISVAGVIEPTQ